MDLTEGVGVIKAEPTVVEVVQTGSHSGKFIVREEPSGVNDVREPARKLAEAITKALDKNETA